jgi:hypothetical protein
MPKTAIDHEYYENVREIASGDYEAALKSLEMVFKQRKRAAIALLEDHGDDLALEYCNEIIRKTLCL